MGAISNMVSLSSCIPDWEIVTVGCLHCGTPIVSDRQQPVGDLQRSAAKGRIWLIFFVHDNENVFNVNGHENGCILVTTLD